MRAVTIWIFLLAACAPSKGPAGPEPKPKAQELQAVRRGAKFGEIDPRDHNQPCECEQKKLLLQIRSTCAINSGIEIVVQRVGTLSSAEAVQENHWTPITAEPAFSVSRDLKYLDVTLHAACMGGKESAVGKYMCRLPGSCKGG